MKDRGGFRGSANEKKGDKAGGFVKNGGARLVGSFNVRGCKPGRHVEEKQVFAPRGASQQCLATLPDKQMEKSTEASERQPLNCDRIENTSEFASLSFLRWVSEKRCLYSNKPTARKSTGNRKLKEKRKEYPS